MAVEPLWDGPPDAPWTVVLAHGAGAPMDSPFLETITAGLVDSGLRVGRFEFPYMQERRHGGRRRPPDPTPVLEATWRAVLDGIADRARCVIGGKSLGGRIASHVAEAAGVAGLVVFGYPFHPPGKPHALRTGALLGSRLPTLVLQGERDPFGSRAEVEGYGLPATLRFCWLPDGDHSFAARVRSGHSTAGNLARAIEAAARFVHGLGP